MKKKKEKLQRCSVALRCLFKQNKHKKKVRCATAELQLSKGSRKRRHCRRLFFFFSSVAKKKGDGSVATVTFFAEEEEEEEEEEGEVAALRCCNATT
jgi:hypothetical protein